MSSISLKESLAEISTRVEPVINDLLSKDVESNNYEAVLYQCKSGGKRIRPALVVLSGQIFGADIDDLLKPAAAIEILHNSTLIIDDIIDHSEFRRDEPTCWNKFGRSIAECAAFDYLASIFVGLNGIKNGPKLIELYGKTLKVIVDGEIKDILFERSGRDDEDFVVKNRYPTITKENYFDMISQKTAVLLQSCCKAGAIYAGASYEQTESIGSFGFNLGMAFQIRDDILDIFGNEKEFGKKIGKDIIEKKMGNYVILSAIEELGAEDKLVIQNLLEGAADVSDADVAMVRDLIDKTGAKATAEGTANMYIQNAFMSLRQLPQNEYSAMLEEVANYIIDRNK